VTFAVIVLAVLPLSLALAMPRVETTTHAVPQSLRQALAEAFAHRSYLLLTTGFFTCGFQLAFVTVHLPSYLVDRGLSAEVGGWTIGVIGLFNIVGSLTAGWLGDRMPKRYLLSLIYFGRALAILVFILVPISPVTCIVFGAFTGYRYGAAHKCAYRRDVRDAMAGDALGIRLFQSSGRRFSRRLARRRRVRPHRLL
jgi:MFS family permease